jgi:hypothetical protein
LITKRCEEGVKNVCCSDHHVKVDSCSCGCGDGITRRFFSRKEKIAKLEEYLRDLRAETEAVEAKISCLKEDK